MNLHGIELVWDRSVVKQNEILLFVGKKGLGTYGMFAFIAPTIWWTHIAITFNGATATTPKGFITCTVVNTFDFSCVVVMGDDTLVVVVVDFVVVFVTADAVEKWRWGEVCEEGAEGREDLGRGRGEVGESVSVECLGRDGRDERDEVVWMERRVRIRRKRRRRRRRRVMVKVVISACDVCGRRGSTKLGD